MIFIGFLQSQTREGLRTSRAFYHADALCSWEDCGHEGSPCSSHECDAGQFNGVRWWKEEGHSGLGFSQIRIMPYESSKSMLLKERETERQRGEHSIQVLLRGSSNHYNAEAHNCVPLPTLNNEYAMSHGPRQTEAVDWVHDPMATFQTLPLLSPVSFDTHPSCDKSLFPPRFCKTIHMHRLNFGLLCPFELRTLLSSRSFLPFSAGLSRERLFPQSQEVVD